jgi:hypothetical protein
MAEFLEGNRLLARDVMIIAIPFEAHPFEMGFFRSGVCSFS